MYSILCFDIFDIMYDIYRFYILEGISPDCSLVKGHVTTPQRERPSGLPYNNSRSGTETHSAVSKPLLTTHQPQSLREPSTPIMIGSWVWRQGTRSRSVLKREVASASVEFTAVKVSCTFTMAFRRDTPAATSTPSDNSDALER